jgi:hypothetical protein
MNADNADVLRSGRSSGVAGISTFMSRTPEVVAAAQITRTVHTITKTLTKLSNYNKLNEINH